MSTVYTPVKTSSVEELEESISRGYVKGQCTKRNGALLVASRKEWSGASFCIWQVEENPTLRTPLNDQRTHS